MGTEDEWLSQGGILSPAFLTCCCGGLVWLGTLVDLRAYLNPIPNQHRSLQCKPEKQGCLGGKRPEGLAWPPGLWLCPQCPQTAPSQCPSHHPVSPQIPVHSG